MAEGAKPVLAVALLKVVSGSSKTGLVARMNVAGANAHLLIVATFNLSLVEGAPLSVLVAEPPLASLMTHIQARSLHSPPFLRRCGGDERFPD